MSCDPNFDQVSLLLHMQGADLSSVFTDSSKHGYVMTASGCHITTADSTLGQSACGQFSGLLTVPLAAGDPLDFTQGVFTVECWIKCFDLNWQHILWSNNNPYTSNTAFIRLYTFGGSIQLQAPGGGAQSDTGLVLNTWHHVACVRNPDGSMQTFIDGIGGLSLGNSTIPAPYTGNLFSIGGDSLSGIQGNYFNGEIQEFRVTKGLARYTANFTPPTEPFGGSCDALIPNVTGEGQAQATADLLAAGLSLGLVTLIGDASAPGTVLSQSPAAGTTVLQGSAVDLTVSNGVLIANVVGMLAREAAAVLTGAGFVLGLTTLIYDAARVGQVLAQSPAAGTYAAPGAYVYLTASQGPRPVYVPDLTGMDQTTAAATLSGLGLLVGVVNARINHVIAGEVIAQNPLPFTQVAAGALIGYTLSLGPALVTAGTGFDTDATVIAQYANSPSILALIDNMSQYFDPTANFTAFYDFVWNVDTAQGFGLDVWGKIVDISRLLQIPNEALTFGFKDGAVVPDVTAFNEAPFNNRAISVTQTYRLSDDAYRTLILCKALANISSTTAPALNQLLRNLFPGRGKCYVEDLGHMAMAFTFEFPLTVTEYAILTQSNALPHPAGVSVEIRQAAATDLWGFTEAGPLAQPFGYGVFYSPSH